MDALSFPASPLLELLELLPPENVIFEHILPLVTPEDWLNLMRVCKKMRTILKSFFETNRTLRILNNQNISPDDFIILTRDAKNLRILDASECSWMSDDLLMPVLKSNQKLRELHLSFSTQPQCRYINYCPKIRTLILHDYPKMDQNRQFFLSYNNEAEANSLFFSVKILGCRSCSSPAFSIFTRLGLDQIMELIRVASFEAHGRTCLLSREKIGLGWSRGISHYTIDKFKEMASEDLWISAAGRMTAIIWQIIEFSKMIPFFLELPQEDQIVLLRAGSFELAVIRMSRYFDLSNDHVLFVGEFAGELDRSLMLPVEAFTTSGDTEEMALVSQIFDCAKTIAQLKLSEEALALYSAYILLQDRPGLINTDAVMTLNEAVANCLEKEILRGQERNKEILSHLLIIMRNTLRDLNLWHLEVFANFMRRCSAETSDMMPGLFRELFSVSTENS